MCSHDVNLSGSDTINLYKIYMVPCVSELADLNIISEV
jgi:hypothetical protein